MDHPFANTKGLAAGETWKFQILVREGVAVDHYQWEEVTAW